MPCRVASYCWSSVIRPSEKQASWKVLYCLATASAWQIVFRLAWDVRPHTWKRARCGNNSWVFQREGMRMQTMILVQLCCLSIHLLPTSLQTISQGKSKWQHHWAAGFWQLKARKSVTWLCHSAAFWMARFVSSPFLNAMRWSPGRVRKIVTTWCEMSCVGNLSRCYQQSFIKYLRLTLIFLWNSAPQEKFKFYFSRVFC